MAWYAVYNDSTGELVSVTSVVDPQSLPPELAFAPLASRPDPEEVKWDSAARAFVPRTLSKTERESRLQDPCDAWLRWKTTLAEATTRGYPAAVITALANKTNAAWDAYVAAIEAWRNA